MKRKASSLNAITESTETEEPSADIPKKPSADIPKKPSVKRKSSGCHSIYWWSIKVACGAILIACVFIYMVYDLSPWFSSSRLLAQALVLVGGLSTIFHYLRLKSVNSKFERPDTLVTDIGLFRYVRHPMYLSDCLTYSGLFLLLPTIASAIVFVVGLVALVKQAEVEDRYLAARFEKQFADWRQDSKLIVPFVY